MTPQKKIFVVCRGHTSRNLVMHVPQLLSICRLCVQVLSVIVKILQQFHH